MLITAGGSFRGGGEGHFLSQVTANSCSLVIVNRSRFRGIPVDVRERRAVLRERLSRVVRNVSRLGCRENRGFAMGRLRGTGGDVRTGLSGLGSRDEGSSVIAFRRLNMSELFVSRTRCFGGLFLCAGVHGINNVTRARTRGSDSLFVGARCLSRVAKNQNMMFTANAPVDGDVIRLCAVRECLRCGALYQRSLRRFST